MLLKRHLSFFLKKTPQLFNLFIAFRISQIALNDGWMDGNFYLEPDPGVTIFFSQRWILPGLPVKAIPPIACK